MFIGHWSAAFAAGAASKSAPRLGTLFLAAQAVDWLFFAFVILGIEHFRIDPEASVLVPFDLYDMPITHSLLGTLCIALVYGAVVWIGMREWTAALITALVVLSHWFLDLLVHPPDLTLFGHPPLLGLGLWNYPWAAIPLELAVTFGAMRWYVKRSFGPPGPPIVLAVLLLGMQLFNWFAPPPERADFAFALLALASFALASLVAWWVGTTRRHRRAIH